MGSAFICVLFTFIVRKESYAEQDNDFRPTPIPLNSWSGEKLDPAGTLQEFIKTDIPPTVAAIPAHYWEDALRHSVYLTLVRDKIDQLIAKGAVISPDGKPENNISREVDDHDLWEKIKAAPFDRVKEDPIPPGDVIILAKGKLLQEKNGFRFTEHDEKCDKNNCTQSVKAYWSVKRVRQGETAPGKYHYELTFSVTSQAPRKVKKPYENPVRTFTIRENDPNSRPPAQTRNYRRHSDRPQRAIWFHKNIVPIQNHHGLPQVRARGLDRIFSSLFGEYDDYDDEITYQRKPNAHIPHAHTHHQQHSKVGYIGDREPHHQKKVIPYTLKTQSFRYNRPPLPAPPVTYMHPHLDVDQGVNNPHAHLHLGNRYFAPNLVKPTKQPFLPTPITTFPFLKESTADMPVKITVNASDFTTKEPEIITTTTYKMYSHKQIPVNSAYFSDNIRPPIYNAPPGVFTTMDKKPFKPMPPLKLMHPPKPYKNIPQDFRPSPQILDTSYTETNSSADTAFRPITLNLTEFLNSKKRPKNNRKTTLSKKPSKKHGNIKTQRVTTLSPEIITARAETEEDDEMEWAGILGAFTKTTPMASQRDKETSSEIDLITTSTVSPTTTIEIPKEIAIISTTIRATTTTTTTTPKTRRTRPPHQFTKENKIKKHKRITTTTTSTTTTGKPTHKYAVNRPSNDLTPQASSAATSAANSVWETKHKEASTSINSTSTTTTTFTTSTSTTPSTTSITTTVKSSTTSSTPATGNKSSVVTTQPRSKNRFRQSTLMQKGTSVNHDKWSTPTFEKNRTLSIQQYQYLQRRKTSKFQGYLSSSTPPEQETAISQDDRANHTNNENQDNIGISMHSVEDILKSPHTTQPTVIQDSETGNNSETNEKPDDDIIEILVENEQENDIHVSKDDKEFIFAVTSPKTNDDLDDNTSQQQSTTEQTVILLSHSIGKNNTKCKKKNHQTPTTTENLRKPNEINTISTISTSPIVSTTPNILEELFGGFTMDDITEKQKTSQSTPTPEHMESESAKYEQYIPIDDDIEDFLHSFDQKNIDTDNDDKSDEEYEEESDDEDSPFNNEEDNSDGKHFNGEYYDDSSEGHGQEHEDRPYSLLELMAME